ncbi:MAG: hypothetical protein GY725_09945 [bacterium]|nr:hypothetical protein [bacterium]
MAGLTTAFLYLFAIDALLSVVDLALFQVTGLHFLIVPLSLLMFALIPWAGLMFVLMVFLPRLPKRILLSVCGLYAWEVLGLMPLPLYATWPTVAGIVNLLALVLSVLIFAWLKAKTGVYQVTEAWLEGRGPAFRWGHLIAYGALSTLFVPLILASYTFFSAVSTLDHFTAGFMQLRLDGLYSLERVYERADQRVHLIGMMHIAREGFYREVLEALPVGDTVVLAEGVRDETDLLGDFNYGRLAEAVNLTEQSSFEVEGGPSVIGADVDVAEFSSSTIDILNAIGRVLQSETREEAIEALLGYGRVAGESEAIEMIWHDVLEIRNRHLLEKLDEALGEYERAVIPWGAVHMMEIEPGVLGRDFVPISETERQVIAFY